MSYDHLLKMSHMDLLEFQDRYPDAFRTLLKDYIELRKIATDRQYWMEAYRNMLGQNALKVLEIWKADGASRVHFSWGPEAQKLTGEERAQIILQTHENRKHAKLIDSIDSLPPSVEGSTPSTRPPERDGGESDLPNPA